MEKLDVDKSMTKGLIFYTDFNAPQLIQDVCLETLKEASAGLDVVSVSLNKPLGFGRNFVVEGTRSYTTMVKQILKGLEESTADIVFFCEADVLYNKSHFDFVPNHDTVFYYNLNSWRWDYPKDRAINHDQTSLSQMCCFRELALDHYRKRLKRIVDEQLDKNDIPGKLQPVWVRALGYEPGTKRRKIGGFSDDVSDRWKSAFPNVDIRHGHTFSHPKIELSHFKHQPPVWREITLKEIPGWELKQLFEMIW